MNIDLNIPVFEGGEDVLLDLNHGAHQDEDLPDLNLANEDNEEPEQAVADEVHEAEEQVQEEHFPAAYQFDLNVQSQEEDYQHELGMLYMNEMLLNGMTIYLDYLNQFMFLIWMDFCICVG